MDNRICKTRSKMSIKEAIENGLIALKASGFSEGGDVYDDLAQALKDLEKGAKITDSLTQCVICGGTAFDYLSRCISCKL